MSSSTHMGNPVSDEPPSRSHCVSVHSSQTSKQSTPATSVSSTPKNVLSSSTGVTSGLGGQYKACLHYSRTMRYGARRCLSGNGEGRHLPGPGAARAPRAVRAGACPSQPGQPRPWASGTSPAMGTDRQAASRAVVGLETASSGLAGAGTDGPRGRSGMWRDIETPRALRH